MRADFRVRPGIPNAGYAAKLSADDNRAGQLIDDVPVEPLVSRAALADVVDARAGPNADRRPRTQRSIVRGVRADERDRPVFLRHLDKAGLVTSAAILDRLAIDQAGERRCRSAKTDR